MDQRNKTRNVTFGAAPVCLHHYLHQDSHRHSVAIRLVLLVWSPWIHTDFFFPCSFGLSVILLFCPRTDTVRDSSLKILIFVVILTGTTVSHICLPSCGRTTFQQWMRTEPEVTWPMQVSGMISFSLVKLPEEDEVGGPVYILEGRVAVQRDLCSPREWSESNVMNYQGQMQIHVPKKEEVCACTSWKALVVPGCQQAEWEPALAARKASSILVHRSKSTGGRARGTIVPRYS